MNCLTFDLLFDLCSSWKRNKWHFGSNQLETIRINKSLRIIIVYLQTNVHICVDRKAMIKIVSVRVSLNKISWHRMHGCLFMFIFILMIYRARQTKDETKSIRLSYHLSLRLPIDQEQSQHVAKILDRML